MFLFIIILLVSTEIRSCEATDAVVSIESVITEQITLENMSKRSISSISLVLTLLAIIFIISDSTRLVGLLMFLGILVFAANASAVLNLPPGSGSSGSEEVNEKLACVWESHPEYLNYTKRLANCEDEKSWIIGNATATEQLFNSSLLACQIDKDALQRKVDYYTKQYSEVLGSKTELEFKVESLQAEIEAQKRYLKNKTDEIERLNRERSEIENRTVSSPFKFVTMKEMKDQRITRICASAGTFNFSQVLHLLHPDMIDVRVNESINVDYELEDTTKFYIDTVIERLKEAEDVDQFHLIANGLFNHYNTYVNDCRSAVIALAAMKYFERHIDRKTLARMLMRFGGNEVSNKSYNIFAQIMHFVKSLFRVTEPIKYYVSPLKAAFLVISGGTLYLLVQNVGKVRRRTGDTTAAVISIICVVVIVGTCFY